MFSEYLHHTQSLSSDVDAHYCATVVYFDYILPKTSNSQLFIFWWSDLLGTKISNQFYTFQNYSCEKWFMQHLKISINCCIYHPKISQLWITYIDNDGILQEVISIWVQLCSVAHFSVIKIRIGAADCIDSNFDDREMGNWTEMRAYWNYFLQNTIFRYVVHKCPLLVNVVCEQPLIENL